MVKISIIIPSWNRKEDLKECIISIKKQTFMDYEIIVVDNGSLDGTIEFLEKECPSILIIKNNKNRGASQARNQAIKIANGEYLWFLDSDAVVLRKDCLKDMLKLFKEDSKIGELGGEVLMLNKELKIRISNPCRNQDGIFTYIDKCRLRKTDYIATSNCIVKKDLVIKAGGFDPYYIYGYEDNNLGYNISKLGYINIVDDKVLVHHKRANVGRMSNFYMWHRNRIRFLILNEKFLFLLFLPFIDIYTTIKILPKRLEETKRLNLDEISLLKTSEKKQRSMIYKVSILGFNYGFNWILGYLWNIIHFPQTLYIRFKKPNFIEK